jgi:16S rRNA processing protein RimM
MLHPHGLEGEMLLDPFLNDVRWYQCLADVAVLGADGHFRGYQVAGIRQVAGRLLVQFESCGSREMVQAMTGLELYVRRDQLPHPPEGEFYWFDLEGLAVYTEDGECLGRVEEFFPTGSNEVLVVRKGSQEVLLPFIRDVILAVDDVRGLIRVRAVPGLL